MSGIISMLVTGVLIFIVLTYLRTEYYIAKEEVNKYGIYPSPLAESYGFQRGDQVLAINEQDYEAYYDLVNPETYLTPGSRYSVLRNGKQVEIEITQSTDSRQDQPFLSLMVPFEVDVISPGSGAEQAGLKRGDQITKVNGKPIITFYDMREEISKDADNEVILEVKRSLSKGIETLEKKVTVDAYKKLGIIW
jgi:regulator of sigma E protease